MIFQKTTLSAEETIALGASLAKLLLNGDVLALWGELGSGKTCLVKGICKGLGTKEEVTSPTFTLINEYSNHCPVYHFDFYRLDSEDDIYGLGYEEYFYGNGICLIEWADRVQCFLPEDRIDVFLTGAYETGRENTRYVKIEIRGKRAQHESWKQFDLK